MAKKKGEGKLKKPANEQRRRSAAPSDGNDEEFGNDDEMMNDFTPIEVKRRPNDQVQGLTEADLQETFVRSLTAGDPNVQMHQVCFDYNSNEYKLDGAKDYLKVHFTMDSDLMHVESDEAKKQEQKRQAKAESVEEGEEPPEKAEAIAQTASPEAAEGEGGEAAAEGEAAPPAAAEEDGTKTDTKLVKNQFNFSERATQTFNNPNREKEECTSPPETCNFVEQVSQHKIFDAYLENIEKKIQQAMDTENKKKHKKNNDDDDGIITSATEGGDEENVIESEAFHKAIKMMERMVHTSSEALDFHNYKYFEDKNERAVGDGRGSFLSLWKFAYESGPEVAKTVTSICWNPVYTDLFAVSYGNYDFIEKKQQRKSGLICCYTLKNTSYPEYIFECESGVMTVAFNKDYPSLLCAGMYDGSVAVYDMRKHNGGVPIFQSHSPVTKHTDPVWQVYWGAETDKKHTNFYSISSDGDVNNWTLAKTELAKEKVCELSLLPVTEEQKADDDVAALLGVAGGSCFDFNQHNPHLFVVGTEEGSIQLYSKEHNTRFVRAYNGHHMAIYTVRWNTFHPDVFLSCSADWTVKLWKLSNNNPVMTFDLNTSVGDVAWSPFSSTVFATITDDEKKEGKVRVFDLDVNKHEPIGEMKMKPSKKARLTNICFNPKEPIICVGDDQGEVQILKLSQNLRKMSAKTLEEIDQEVETARLDKVMILPESNEEEDINVLLEKANSGNTDIGS